MIPEENATVLLFRDAALRRPIDVVAWMNTERLRAIEPGDATDNVVSLARFARSSRTYRCLPFGGPPEGEAA